jgi:Ca2+-transporting ATPase
MALGAVAVTFGWFAWRMGMDTDLAQARTETFTLLAMCQWFNVLNCQSPTRSVLGPGLLRNRWLMAGLAASVILQFAVIYVPAMNVLFHTVALPLPVVLFRTALASAGLAAEELRKFLARASAKPGSRTAY